MQTLTPTTTLSVVGPREHQALTLLVDVFLSEYWKGSAVDGNSSPPECVLQWPGFMALEVDDLLLQVDVFPPQATNLRGVSTRPAEDVPEQVVILRQLRPGLIGLVQ